MNKHTENEKKRLDFLKSLEILDTEYEKEFDNIVELASLICNTPIALISLLDENRQWFKAKKGLDIRETPREISFCQYTIQDKKLFQVKNASKDDTFKDNPLVTEDPNILFYAGVPIHDESGFNIGSLCVIDKKENVLNDYQKEALTLLSKQVISLLKLRIKKKQLEISKNNQESLIESLQEGYVFQNCNGEITNCNITAEKILGLSFDQMIGKKSVDPSWRSIHEDGSDFPGETHPSMVTLQTKKHQKNIIMGVHKPNNELTWISINSSPIFKDDNKTLEGVVSTFRDITKSKIITEQFDKIIEHDFISKIISKTKDAVLITDKNGIIVWCNQAFEKLSEYSIEEVIGKKPGKLLQGPETDQNTIKKIKHAILNKVEIDTNILNYTKNKKQYWLNLNISPIFKDDKKKEVEYFIAIERDVTNLVKIESEKEIQYNNLIESQSIAKIGSWEFNITNHNLVWSEEHYKIFELENTIPPEKLYDAYRSKIHPEDIPLLDQLVQNAIDKGEGFKFEHRLIGQNGIKYVVGIGKLILKENKPFIIKGTIQDITEKKLQEIEYNISNERWRFAVENSGDGIWDYDLITQESFQSDQFLENIGYKQNELSLSHETILEMIHPDDRDRVDKAFKDHLASISPILELEYRIKHKNGYYKWIYDRAKVIEKTENGEPKRIIGIHQDLTQRKKVDFLHNTINNLNERFIKSNDNNHKAFKSVLDDLIDITDSEYGFIGEVFYDDEKPWLKTYALTNIAWNKESQELYNEYHIKGFEFKNLDTLFGYTLKTKEITISDDPTNDPRSGGLPGKHPDLNKFLGIPILYHEELIGMIGLANKPNGYSEEEVDFLLPLIENISNVIQNIKTKRIENKQQKEIAYKEERIRSLVEGMDELVFVLDKDLNYKEYFSKKNTELEKSNLSIQPEFFIGKNISDVGFSETLLNQIKNVINNNIQNNINEKLDYMLPINGEEKWFQANFSVVRNSQHEIEDIIVVSRDLTEEKRIKESALKSQKELQSFFDLTNDFMCIANIDGTFRRVNNQFIKSLGYSSEELNEKLFLDFIHPEDVDITLKEIEKLSQGIPTIGFENRYKTKEGNYIWLSWRTSPDPSSGLLYATARDVTNDKIIKEELVLQKQKAEYANKAKSEFLANMSHEIRTPLNGIIGFSEILQKTDLNDNQKLYVNTLVQAGNSLLSIINDILDFSKIEAGKLELNIEKNEISTLIYETFELVTYQAQSKNLDLIIDLDTELPKFLYLDITQLKQVLINLLGNAIKFTKTGEITIRVKKIKNNTNTIRIKFSVIDTGIGISKNNLSKIFDAFSQADNTTTREYGGTGLGLNISNSIIKLMGGDELQVISKPNKGSEFFFDLDLAYEEEQFTPLFNIQKKLLLINSNGSENKIIKKTLKKDSIEVTCIKKVKEAHLKIEKNPKYYDFILIDSKLYNTENNNALKELINLPNFDLSKTPIGLITRSIHDETYYDECKELGLVSRINKPIKIKHLREQLLQLEKNKLTTFKKFLPHPSKRLKILIVDDNSINRLLLKTIIGDYSKDIDILEAKNGEEAVKTYKTNHPQLVLIDLIMPIMDGYEATKEIHKIKENNFLEIYAISAGAKDEVFINNFMNGFIEKPIDNDELKSIIISCIKNQKNK